MIRILISRQISERFLSELKIAGQKEIGGILMGEYIEDGVFRIVDFTAQRTGGTFASFIRMIDNVASTLKSFFVERNHQFAKYNYLGEWHSHPSFSLAPSSTDHQSMTKIIIDRSVGANFVVLLILKIEQNNLCGTVTLYTPDQTIRTGRIILQ